LILGLLADRLRPHNVRRRSISVFGFRRRRRSVPGAPGFGGPGFGGQDQGGKRGRRPDRSRRRDHDGTGIGNAILPPPRRGWFGGRRGCDWTDACDACQLLEIFEICDVCNFLGVMSLFGFLARTDPTRPPRDRPSLPGRAGAVAIRGYQRWVSPRLGIRCRHEPSCSAYGLTAVRRYGLGPGSRLTAARIGRCTRDTPFGTLDPVPSQGTGPGGEPVVRRAVQRDAR
jgi:putative membrane protein insertion efficiency factor